MDAQELIERYYAGERDFGRAHLVRADLSGAVLSEANLSEANLNEADLSGADLTRACLDKAHLDGANLTDANLEGTFLYGACLSGANLTGANLEGAHLHGADLSGATMPDGTADDCSHSQGDTSEKLSGVQRFFTAVLFPFAGSIERHSRNWRMTCSCGHSTSIWERGGIRWHAAGEARRLAFCESCGTRSWHRIHRVECPPN